MGNVTTVDWKQLPKGLVCTFLSWQRAGPSGTQADAWPGSLGSKPGAGQTVVLCESEFGDGQERGTEKNQNERGYLPIAEHWTRQNHDS